MGPTGFDSNTQVVKRIDLNITAKVINLFNAPMRLAA